jgi:L-fuconate dehydratase
MIFKQLLQAEAIDACQIDSCRLAGINEILAVMLMSARFGVPVVPHAGGVGLCEMVIHRELQLTLESEGKSKKLIPAKFRAF